MPELPHMPAEKSAAPHTDAHKIGALVASPLLLLGSNMPGVGYRTEHTNQIQVQHEFVEEQVPVTLPANPTETRIVLTPDVDNEYRVDFQTTQQDAESSRNQVGEQLQDALGVDGWARVYDIQVTGKASAEDEQAGGGLQEDSQKNTDLALQRALLAVRPVIDSFAAHGIDVHQMVEKQPGQAAEEMIQVAGVEDSWSDKDLADASAFAQQYGYDNAEQMIEHYNDGGTPPNVDEFLRPLLDDQRGAEIVLKLRDADGGEGEQIMVTRIKGVTTVRVVDRDIKHRDIVNNQTIGNIPEHEEMPKSTSDDVATKDPKNTTITDPHIPSSQGVTPNVPAVTPVNRPPKNPRPSVSYGLGRKDALFRQKQRAPQGNGQRPVINRGRVHQSNPTPHNF